MYTTSGNWSFGLISSKLFPVFWIVMGLLWIHPLSLFGESPYRLAPEMRAAAVARPVLRAYPVAPEVLQQVAGELQAIFPTSPDLRIVANSQTHQIVALASLETHQIIQERLRSVRPVSQPIRQVAQLEPVQTPSPESSQPQSPRAEPLGSANSPSVTNRTAPALQRPPATTAIQSPRSRKEFQLVNIDWQTLESELTSLWGGKPVTSPGGQQLSTLLLPCRDGRRVQLTIDRLNGRGTLDGERRAVESCMALIRAVDRKTTSKDDKTSLVPLHYARREKVEKALSAVERGANSPAASTPALRPRTTPASPTSKKPLSETQLVPTHVQNRPHWAGDLVSMIFQPEDETTPTATANDTTPPSGIPMTEITPGGISTPGGQPDVNALINDPSLGRLIGPVQIEYLEGLDVIVVRGHKLDVEKVSRLIDQIENLSAETEPVIEFYQLAHTDSVAMSTLVMSIYEQIMSPRLGQVSITPLVKPNSLLLIGRRESVDAVAELTKKLDVFVEPSTQFKVFQLSHLPATEAEWMVRDFFDDAAEPNQQGDRGVLGTKIRVIADQRSNALIVQAGPRDMDEVALLIKRIDVNKSQSSNELRVFKLKNALAEDLVPVLEEAILDESSSQQRGGTGGGQSGRTGSTRSGQTYRSAMLSFMTVDARGGRLLKSGILRDVRISADARGNALLVTAPADCMELIAALIRHLDELPTAESQIKVFTIQNGDVTSLVGMLEDLFGEQSDVGEPMTHSGAGSDESTLTPIRFSFDVRTNSIVASGSQGDLLVVEAVLLRLDESDARDRKSVVYRLKHAPAADVATAINEFLEGEREVQQIDPSLISPYQQIEKEAVVVAEPVSNSLIVSASPRYFSQIEKLVEDLDSQPPMVLIQVLIAAVDLGDVNEFGVEWGIQDSLLFDRSTIGTNGLNPGYNFNNNPPGNSGSAESLANSSQVAGQALTNFLTGRTSSSLNYGGLVLSAGSESVNVLVRALRDTQRLEVLSRPQVMTLDNQPAFVQIGERVPRVTSAQLTEFGSVNNIVLDDVGLILGVTPRVSPDGLVVMEIDTERSEVGPIEEGIPISVSEGQVIYSPRIEVVTAQTTVSARTGQTVVLGGMITKNISSIRRRVPVLGDIPVVGTLFRYDSLSEKRTELLIIMTPHVVRSAEEIEWVSNMESERLSWCMMDMSDMAMLGDRFGNGHEGTEVIYPAEDPTGSGRRLLPGQALLPMGPRMRAMNKKTQEMGKHLQSMTPNFAPSGQKFRPGGNLSGREPSRETFPPMGESVPGTLEAVPPGHAEPINNEEPASSRSRSRSERAADANAIRQAAWRQNGMAPGNGPLSRAEEVKQRFRQKQQERLMEQWQQAQQPKSEPQESNRREPSRKEQSRTSQQTGWLEQHRQQIQQAQWQQQQPPRRYQPSRNERPLTERDRYTSTQQEKQATWHQPVSRADNSRRESDYRRPPQNTYREMDRRQHPQDGTDYQSRQSEQPEPRKVLWPDAREVSYVQDSRLYRENHYTR